MNYALKVIYAALFDLEKTRNLVFQTAPEEDLKKIDEMRNDLKIACRLISYAGRGNNSLSIKEIEFVNYLYNQSGLTIDQISRLIGVSSDTIIKTAKKERASKDVAIIPITSRGKGNRISENKIA